MRRGPESQFPDVDPIWHYGFLFSPALTLGGGTFAVQRNIVAEHALGLPREPDLEKGLTRVVRPVGVPEILVANYFFNNILKAAEGSLEQLPLFFRNYS